MTVIVTDAHLRTALYVVRSLGRMGVRVVCVSDQLDGYGLRSRYCWKAERTPSPRTEPQEYLERIHQLVDAHGVRVIIPIHEDSIFLFAHPDVRNEFAGVEVPIPELTVLQRAVDKAELVRLAADVGIPVPLTYHVSSPVELGRISHEVNYPAIIKVRKEQGISPGPDNRYRFVSSPEELAKWYEILSSRQPEPVVQEVIHGYGCGFFALYDKTGRVVAYAGHRRIREQFPTGGPSTFCESHHDPRVQEYGTRLLSALGWYGVAMVEFKVDERDGEPKLMEINPRFWGTTPVAILSGVDFPYLLYRVAIGEPIAPQTAYRTGLRVRFLFDDLLAFLRYLKNEKSVTGRLRLCCRFMLDVLDPRVKEGVLSLDDISPSLFYIKSWIMRFALLVLCKIRSV